MKLIYATSNKLKLQLAQQSLDSFGITLVDCAWQVPEIQSMSQEAVAIDKARKLYKLVHKPLVAMDSGLFVETLDGFPGVYTKDIMQQIGIDGLLQLTAAHKKNKAYTQRTIAYTDGKIVKTFSSKCEGEIIPDKRGSNGRDYDLIFYLPKKKKTLAELSDVDKSKLTGEAWQQFGKWFTKYQSK